MKEKLNNKNELEDLVVNHKLHLKSNFVKIDNLHLQEFPRISESTIHNKITIGSYQLKQSLSYLHEHFHSNGNNFILVNKVIQSIAGSKIIHMQFRSRFSNRTKHKTFVKYIPFRNDSDSVQG